MSRQAAQTFRKLTQQHETAVEHSKALQAQVEHLQRLADDRAQSLSTAREDLVQRQAAAEQHLRQREASMQKEKEAQNVAHAKELALMKCENERLSRDLNHSQQNLLASQKELSDAQKQKTAGEEARLKLKLELDAAAGEILDLNMQREEDSCRHQLGLDKLKAELRAERDDAVRLARQAVEERTRSLQESLHDAQAKVQKMQERCESQDHQYARSQQDKDREHRRLTDDIVQALEEEKQAHARSRDSMAQLEIEVAELKQALETQVIAAQDSSHLSQQLQQQVAVTEEELRIKRELLDDTQALLKTSQGEVSTLQGNLCEASVHVSECTTQLEREQMEARVSKERIETLLERVKTLEESKQDMRMTMRAREEEHAKLVQGQREEVGRREAAFEARLAEMDHRAFRSEEMLAEKVEQTCTTAQELLTLMRILEAAAHTHVQAQEHELTMIQRKLDAERRGRAEEEEHQRCREEAHAAALHELRCQVAELNEGMHTAADALKSAHHEAEMWSQKAQRLKAHVADMAQVYCRARSRNAKARRSSVIFVCWRLHAARSCAAEGMARRLGMRKSIASKARSFRDWETLYNRRQVVRRCISSTQRHGRDSLSIVRCLTLWREALLVQDQVCAETQALEAEMAAAKVNHAAQIEIQAQTHRIQAQLMQQTAVSSIDRRRTHRLKRCALMVWSEMTSKLANVTARLVDISLKLHRRLMSSTFVEFKRLVASLSTARLVSLGKVADPSQHTHAHTHTQTARIPPEMVL